MDFKDLDRRLIMFGEKLIMLPRRLGTQRPAIDVMAEKLGVDLTRPATVGRPMPHRAPYVVLGDKERGSWGRIDFLKVRRSGRFGNNCQQLIQAAALAEAHSIREVYHPFGWCRPSPADAPVRLIKGRPRLGVGLAGKFYSGHNLKFLRALSHEDYIRAARRHLKPCFPWQGGPPAKGRIVAHLRGGDVMGRKPHPNFVQPPLAFYTLAIRQMIRDFGPMSVEIVAEDRKNPVLEPLLDWAEAAGLAPDFQLGSRNSDAARILAAEHLVIGFSSFPRILALMSDNLRSVAAFRAAPRELYAQMGLEKYYAYTDPAQGYIPPGGWQNTPEQRRMMVDYPRENLRLRRPPGPE